MAKDRTTLLFDGSHYRITIPRSIIEERGWQKGDPLLIDNNNGGIVVRKGKTRNARPMVFSIGYEGKSIDQFTSMLREAKVEQLIDVRENPFSYKEGFSKGPLKEHLQMAGIVYQHVKELGTEKMSRDEYKKTGDISKLLKVYSDYLAKNKEKYELLLALANYKESAIMCFEEDFRMCHRQVLENNLRMDGFEVIHLCNGKQEKF